jgi:hypothetical protein
MISDAGARYRPETGSVAPDMAEGQDITEELSFLPSEAVQSRIDPSYD